jgi:hypothetical protein
MSDPIYEQASDNTLLRRILGFIKSITSSGGLAINTTLSGGDLQIGAVELKDSTTSNRAVIDSSGRVATVPTVTASSFGTVQTANPGTNYATLTSAACRAVTLLNTTGTDLEVRRGGAGAAFPVQDGMGYTFEGLTNANELSVRRVDTSNTQVTATYEVES